MNFKKIGCQGVDLVHLAKDRIWWWKLEGMVMNLQHSLKDGNFLSSWQGISSS
jgi:hypothetical protein